MVHVEFYGIPRRRAGVAQIEIDIPGQEVRLGDIYRQLANRLPVWAEACLEGDRLQNGFLANLDGTRFVDDPELRIDSESCLLIMTADAGG